MVTQTQANATRPAPISTEITRMLGIDFPVIAGPMFLVSDPNLVAAVSEAGGLGVMPSLNWRTPEEFREAVREVKRRTSRPFGVNLIVNQANFRVQKDLDICAEEGVPLVVTSLGNPGQVIRRMHETGSKVFCDVTTLDYARKVQDLGADAVIAVSAGAGGHAGPTSPLVLLPYLRKHLRVPVIAAGGICTGEQTAAALLLGASAVQIGTRFIATPEARVDPSYKEAILRSSPDDIILTKKVSGSPCAVIRTPYVDRQGTELNWIESRLLKNPRTKKYVKLLRAWLGSEALKKAVTGPTWKEVWSAGQGVGLIDSIEPAAEVVWSLAREFHEAKSKFSG